MPGRYTVLCWVAVMRNDEETAHQTMKLLDFVVFGVDGGTGMVAVPGELGVEVEPAPARRGGPVSAQARARAAGSSRPIGPGRRLEALRGASLPALGHRVQGTYFGTVLGYLWSLLRPLLLFAVLLFVFTKIVRLGSQVPHYPVLLLFNVVLFGFFSESTQAAVTSVVSQESVVRKTQFPRMVIPLSVVLTSLFNLGMNLIVVLVFLLAFGVYPTWTWLLFPLIVVAAVRLRDRRLASALLALRPFSRHGDHLVGDGRGALLRDARALSDRERRRAPIGT